MSVSETSPTTFQLGILNAELLQWSLAEQTRLLVQDEMDKGVKIEVEELSVTHVRSSVLSERFCASDSSQELSRRLKDFCETASSILERTYCFDLDLGGLADVLMEFTKLVLSRSGHETVLHQLSNVLINLQSIAELSLQSQEIYRQFVTLRTQVHREADGERCRLLTLYPSNDF
eukprot:RCo008369